MGKIRWLGFGVEVFVGGWQDVFQSVVISLSIFLHGFKGIGNKKSDSNEPLFLSINELIIHYDLSSL